MCIGRQLLELFSHFDGEELVNARKRQFMRHLIAYVSLYDHVLGIVLLISHSAEHLPQQLPVKNSLVEQVDLALGLLE